MPLFWGQNNGIILLYIVINIINFMFISMSNILQRKSRGESEIKYKCGKCKAQFKICMCCAL